MLPQNHAYAERLECLRAVMSGTDDAATAAVQSLAAASSEDILNAALEIPWCREASPAIRNASDASARLGLGHARAGAPFPVPIALRPTPAFVVPRSTSRPEISGLLCTSGNTLLHLAAARGLTKCVEELLLNGAQTDLTNAAGDTPLEVATNFVGSHASSRATLDVLLAAPTTDSKHYVLPSWTDAWVSIRDAADEDAARVVELLLRLGVDVEHPKPVDEEASRNEAEMRTLFDRKKKASWATIRAALVFKSKDVDDRQDGRDVMGTHRRLETREWFDFCGSTAGFTLLHLACARNKPLCCSLLLAAGGDPLKPALASHHARDEDTPLSLAQDNNHRRCVATIKTHLKEAVLVPAPLPPPRTPAAAMQASESMRTALSHVTVGGEPSWAFVWDEVREAPDAVALKAVHARYSSFKRDIDKARLDGYGRDAGRTLAHLAASRGKLRTLAALRDVGCNLDSTDLDGMTPMQLLALAPRTAFDAAVAAEVGLDLHHAPLPPPPPAPPSTVTVWTAAFAAVRDLSESDAMPFVLALASAPRGADAYGRHAAHRADGSPHNLLTLAAERGYRRALQALRASLREAGRSDMQTEAQKQPFGNCPRFQRFGESEHWMRQQGSSTNADSRRPLRPERPY